jgi:hypothetical protein
MERKYSCLQDDMLPAVIVPAMREVQILCFSIANARAPFPKHSLSKCETLGRHLRNTPAAERSAGRPLAKRPADAFQALHQMNRNAGRVFVKYSPGICDVLHRGHRHVHGVDPCRPRSTSFYSFHRIFLLREYLHGTSRHLIVHSLYKERRKVPFANDSPGI